MFSKHHYAPVSLFRPALISSISNRIRSSLTPVPPPCKVQQFVPDQGTSTTSGQSFITMDHATPFERPIGRLCDLCHSGRILHSFVTSTPVPDAVFWVGATIIVLGLIWTVASIDISREHYKFSSTRSAREHKLVQRESGVHVLPNELLQIVIRKALYDTAEPIKSRAGVLQVCRLWHNLGKAHLWEHAAFVGDNCNLLRKGLWYLRQVETIRSVTTSFPRGEIDYQTISLGTAIICHQLPKLEALSLDFRQSTSDELSSYGRTHGQFLGRPLDKILRNLPPTCLSLELRFDTHCHAQSTISNNLPAALGRIKVLRLVGMHHLFDFVAGIAVTVLPKLEELTFVLCFESPLQSAEREPDRSAETQNSEFQKITQQLRQAYTTGAFPGLRHGIVVSPNIAPNTKSRHDGQYDAGVRVIGVSDIVGGATTYNDVMAVKLSGPQADTTWMVFHNLPPHNQATSAPTMRQTTGKISDILQYLQVTTGGSWQDTLTGTRVPTSFLRSERGFDSGLTRCKLDITVRDFEPAAMDTPESLMWSRLQKKCGLLAPRTVPIELPRE